MITTKALRKLKLKGVDNALRDTIEPIRGYAVKKQGQSKGVKREPWPVCSICQGPTSANPGKTPQWWDNQWQCENCTFGEYKLEKVKGKYE